jgi:hypothetical protein
MWRSSSSSSVHQRQHFPELRTAELNGMRNDSNHAGTSLIRSIVTYFCIIIFTTGLFVTSTAFVFIRDPIKSILDLPKRIILFPSTSCKLRMYQHREKERAFFLAGYAFAFYPIIIRLRKLQIMYLPIQL